MSKDQEIMAFVPAKNHVFKWKGSSERARLKIFMLLIGYPEGEYEITNKEPELPPDLVITVRQNGSSYTLS